MKMRLFMLLMVLCSTVSNVFAYDFQSGSLYYNITSDSTVAATSGYRGLTSVIIPESVTYNGTTYRVTSIGDYAFSGCSGLTSITIPNGVTSIGESAFYGCTGLTSIVVEKGNTVYDSRNNCNAIVETSTNTLVVGCQNATIPNSVTSIGERAFETCSGLTSITIPNSVTSIGERAFETCSGLTSITIPNSVTSIGESAFSSCIGLTSIVVEKGNTVYDSRNNCNAIVETSTNTLVVGCQNATIPNSVTSIGDEAFSNCSGLTSITIPNSVTSIGDRAFFWCSGLTSVTIPNSVTYIGDMAFFGCSGLTSVTIPNSVTYIGNAALEVTPWRESWLNQQQDGVIYIGNMLYNYKGEMPQGTNIVVKEGTVCICGGAFDGYSGLASITIPNSVTSIGSGAFSGCSGLTSITIPNSVTSIGNDAFSNCSGLTSIIIPNSITSIGNSAFSGCSSLTSITIPNSVTSIGDGVFSYCDSLTAITIPNSVTSIGERAFSFSNGLTSITIPNSVTSIGERAFYFCRSLTSVTIGNSVTSIGDRAFEDCDLQTITFHSFTPIANWEEAFYHCYNCKVVNIPCGSKKDYIDAGWKSWLLKEFLYSVSVATEDAVKGTAQVDKQTSCGNEAIISATPNYGYHFTQWNDGNTDNPRALFPTSDTIYTAMFALNQYTITTLAQENGTVSGTGMYDYGTETTLTATPAEHYHFTQWNDGNTDNPRTVLVERDSTFIAEFAINTHKITVTYDMKMGYVSGDDTYDYGTRVRLVAEPNSGYVFSQWSDGTTYNPYIFTATEDVTLEASFIPSTAVENTSAEDTKGVQKVLHNGQIYILRNGKVYDVVGREGNYEISEQRLILK